MAGRGIATDIYRAVDWKGDEQGYDMDLAALLARRENDLPNTQFIYHYDDAGNPIIDWAVNEKWYAEAYRPNPLPGWCLNHHTTNAHHVNHHGLHRTLELVPADFWTLTRYFKDDEGREYLVGGDYGRTPGDALRLCRAAAERCGFDW